MGIVYVILATIALIANVTMDEIRFHWNRWFGKVIKENSHLETWMNPSKSWVNKYKIQNKIVTWLLSTSFVWLTDFWHFLKFILLNSFFAGFLLAINTEHFWIDIIAMNIGWGLLYETFKATYGLLADGKEK